MGLLQDGDRETRLGNQTHRDGFPTPWPPSSANLPFPREVVELHRFSLQTKPRGLPGRGVLLSELLVLFTPTDVSLSMLLFVTLLV